MTKSSKIIAIVAVIIMIVTAIINIHCYSVMDSATTSFNISRNGLEARVALNELDRAYVLEGLSGALFLFALIGGVVFIACNERVARVRRERTALENRYR